MNPTSGSRRRRSRATGAVGSVTRVLLSRHPDSPQTDLAMIPPDGQHRAGQRGWDQIIPQIRSVVP